METLSDPGSNAVVQYLTSDISHPVHQISNMGIRSVIYKLVHYDGIAYIKWISAADYDTSLCCLKLSKCNKIFTEIMNARQLCYANRLISHNSQHNS